MNNIDSLVAIPRLKMFTDEQIEQIYEAVIVVLEEQGSIVAHDESRELLLNAGAKKGEGDKILIPRKMVEDAVKTAPKSIKIYSRDGKEAMDLGGWRTYFATTCDAMDTIDAYTGERRPFVSDDWYTAAKLMDYLPNMHCMLLNGCANDMSPAQAYREIGYATMLNTRIPLGLAMGDVKALEEIVGLAELVAGGAENFKKKPTVYLHAEPVSPLEHHGETLEMLLLAAEREVPVVYYGMQMQGVTAPITSAGIIVVSVAETLAGLVIHQLKKPGAPFIFGGIPAAMDMKSTVFSYGCPEMVRNTFGMIEVAHYLNLPNFGTTCTDSKDYDAQCGVEYAISTLAAILGGHNLVHDVGFLDQASAFSLQTLVLCEEIIKMCQAVTEGVSLDKDSIALDIINEVGPGGNFLMHNHTLSRFKDLWKPYVFDRSVDYRKVEPLKERLEKEVRRILETHEVPSLPEDMLKAIDEYKKSWDEKLAQ